MEKKNPVQKGIFQMFQVAGASVSANMPPIIDFKTLPVKKGSEEQYLQLGRQYNAQKGHFSRARNAAKATYDATILSMEASNIWSLQKADDKMEENVRKIHGILEAMSLLVDEAHDQAFFVCLEEHDKEYMRVHSDILALMNRITKESRVRLATDQAEALAEAQARLAVPAGAGAAPIVPPRQVPAQKARVVDSLKPFSLKLDTLPTEFTLWKKELRTYYDSSEIWRSNRGM
ncbi:MAG: hypothetical protein HC888_04335 [Candidatus Competibacteraceae bacterium]|nr:hypothetical protein [Candidatus Competibacteraceae bacterium]